MVGALARNFRSANRSEVLAHFLLSSWGTVTSVSAGDDYGIDLYCTLTEEIGLRAIVTDYYSVQVKSTDEPWVFESPEAIKWLFDYSTPLFLGCVDRTKTVLSVYQTLPRFLASFWDPGARLTLEPSNDVRGKCAQWSGEERFSLSAPILRVSLAELSDRERLKELRSVFRYWVQLDNYNCDLRRVGLLRFRMPAEYEANIAPTNSALTEQGRWRVTPQQLKRAIGTLIEAVDCVGHQLLGDGDKESALYAALLLRHLFSHGKVDLASDPRWSQGVWPGVVHEVAHKLNAALTNTKPTTYLLEGLDEVAKTLHALEPVRKYLDSPSKAGD